MGDWLCPKCRLFPKDIDLGKEELQFTCWFSNGGEAKLTGYHLWFVRSVVLDNQSLSLR